MASFNRVVMSGSTNLLNVTFPYLDKAHVTPYLDGVALASGTYTWQTDSQIAITAGNPAAGTIGETRRRTPSEAITTFSPGNLDVSDLNVASLQPLFLAEEARDAADDYGLRGWTTAALALGGTIQKGTSGQLAQFDVNGNLVPTSIIPNPGTGEGLMLESVYAPQIANSVRKRPERIKCIKMSDLNGGTEILYQNSIALVNHIKANHPDIDVIYYDGDMAPTGDGTKNPEDRTFTLDDFLNVMRSGTILNVPRWAIRYISGNHEVDRNLDGSNPQYSGTYESFKRRFKRRLYYFAIRGNTIDIHMGAVSRNGRGVIPDEIVAWCKRIVADHQWCSIINIHTHQPLPGTGLAGADAQGQLLPERWSWVGDPGYRVNFWYSGHTGYDFSNPSVVDHVTWKGCTFIATDNGAQTYVSYDLVDGAQGVTFYRWDRLVPGVPTKTWIVPVSFPIETQGEWAFDGLHQDDGIYSVRPEPLEIMVQQPRELVSGAWRWPVNKPYTVLAVGLTDLANDNADVGQGPAIDFRVPGAPSGFAGEPGDGSNNPLLNHAWGYGGRIATVRSGNGEYDWGAVMDFYVGLPSTDPHGADGTAIVGQNTEAQLKRVMSLGTGVSILFDGTETEVARWDPTGFLTGRTATGGSTQGTGSVSLKTGENRQWVAGTGQVVFSRFYQDALGSPAQCGNIQGVNGQLRIYMSGSGHFFGLIAGSPEGSLTAPVGSAVWDTTNGTQYNKKTGTGNTGWKLVTQAT